MNGSLYKGPIISSHAAAYRPLLDFFHATVYYGVGVNRGGPAGVRSGLRARNKNAHNFILQLPVKQRIRTDRTASSFCSAGFQKSFNRPSLLLI